MNLVVMLLPVALASAVTGFGLSHLWSARSRRMERARIDLHLASQVHHVRQPVQAIELYIAALARRLETDDQRELAERIHLATADAHARLTEMAQGFFPEDKHRPEASRHKRSVER